MRKLIIKHFVGDWKYQSNYLKWFSEIVLNLSIAFIIVKPQWIVSYLALASAAALFVAGQFADDKLSSRPRASIWCWYSLLFAGYFSLLEYYSLSFVFVALFASYWLLISPYLKKNPAKWNELDDSQKWQTGNGILLGDLDQCLTEEQWKEWTFINIKYEQ